MSGKVSPLGLRLFLEGVEVPVISAAVSVQPDVPATASIQIIPTDMGLHLLPRTLVHLFYLDTHMSDEEIEEAKKQADPETTKRNTPDTDQTNLNRFEASDFQYRLLFTGEVTSLHYAKTPANRQLVLQCMDLSTYWDTCYQYFSDYSLNGNALTDKHHNFVGAGEGLFDNFSGTQWVISRVLNTKPRTPEFQEATGLLGGMIHMLEVIGGIRYRNSKFEGFRGVNDFFTIAELRYNLLGMLGAVEKDKTTAKMYANKAFTSWLKNGMTSLGSLVSFRDILNHLNRYVFHNIYPNPCAQYVSGGETVAKVRKKSGTVNVLDSTVGSVWTVEINRVRGKLNSVATTLAEILEFTKRSTVVATPSIANVPIIGEQLQKGILNNLLRDVKDRKPVTWNEYTAELKKPGLKIDSIARDTRECHDILKEVISALELSTARDASLVSVKLRAIQLKISDAYERVPQISRVESYLNDGYSFSKGSKGAKIKSRLEEAEIYVTDALDELDDLMGKKKAKYRTDKIRVPESSHLYNQLFLPECFFVSPPRCNVIFPDQYFDIKYSRNFMREVSRLAMQGGIGMTGGRRGAKIFSKFYLAPNIRDVRGQVLQASLSRASRVILPHEVHSGIIPKMAWVTDGHRWGVKAAKESKNKKPSESQKVHYLQRLAEFQFYLNRWSARTLTLDGVFNPNIVAGFPAVVIDRASPAPEALAQIEKVLRRRMLPTQFVGKVHSYTHAIHQGGGSTSIQFAYARTHRSLDDEFMGVKTKEITQLEGEGNLSFEPKTLDQLAKNISARRLAVYQRITRLWASGKLGPKVEIRGLGKIQKVTILAYTYATKSQALAAGIPESFFENNKEVTAARERAEEVTVPTLRAKYAVLVPDRIELLYTPRVGTGRFERSSIAFEDAVRPGWFAPDVWTNEKITEAVYKPLLGSMAITDDVGLGQDQQNEILKRWANLKKQNIGTYTDLETGLKGNPEDRSEDGTVETESIDDKFVYTVVPGSVEESIDGLSLIYGMMRSRNDDVQDFIRDFTRRPIANMIDILGTQNVTFDGKGELLDKESMIEGFHSRAFGDYNTDVRLPDRAGGETVPGKDAGKALMSGVADPSKVARPRIISKTHKKSAFRPELDPRGRARGRVWAYMAELTASRGLLSQ